MRVHALGELRAVVGELHDAPPQQERRGPSLDPRLVTAYSPRTSWREESAEPPATWQMFHTPPADFCCDLPALPPGLVLARNSDTPPKRNGWKGITPFARQSISRACAALEDQRARLAFWTITLSPAQLDRIEAFDTWPAFQNAIRHRLVRALRARGLRPLVIGVVELHPKRSVEEGRPCPHLHVVFVGRAHAWARWALSTAELDLIICKALVAAQCFDLEVAAAGNVQPVRRSVGGYLSHYMKKGSVPPAVCGRAFQLCPRQWFFQSTGLLRMVRSITVRLPLPFVAFLHERVREVEDRGWATWQKVDIPDPRAPAVYTFLWESVEAVAAALAHWQESQWDADWGLNHRLRYGRAHPRQHSERDQHL